MIVSTSVNGVNWTTCEDLGDKLTHGEWVDATCPGGTKGNFVRIDSRVKERLMLCEVEARGYTIGKFCV